MDACISSAEVSRAWTYKLLAECYHPPAAGALDRVRDLCGCLTAVGSPGLEIAERLAAALSEDAAEALAVDHARLFVGPFGLLAPPYGSVHLENQNRLMGDSTLAASLCYREAGLEVAADFNDAPDHIAAELEFMHYLAYTELKTRTGGDPERAQRFRRRQADFLERHLAAWVPAFTRAVAEHAQTNFYRAAAAETRVWVDCDTGCDRGTAATETQEVSLVPQGGPAATCAKEAKSGMTFMGRSYEQISSC